MVNVSKLEDGKLPFASMVIWQVAPSHEMTIQFSTGEYSGTTLIRFIAEEKGRWLIVLPIPNDKTLKKYAQRKEPKQTPAVDAEDAGE